MQTPEDLALAGFSMAVGARVVARHQTGDYAAVYVAVSDGAGRANYLGLYRRRRAGWSEQVASVGGGPGWVWCAFEEEPYDGDVDEPLGVLVGVGELAEPGTVQVELDGVTVTAASSERYWMAMFVGVDHSADRRARVQEHRPGQP